MTATRVGLSALLLLRASFASSTDLDFAPPAFDYQESVQAVFVNFIRSDLKITYDISGRTATGVATILFDVGKSGGFPVFDLVPKLQRAFLDGVEVAPELIPVVTAPGGATKFRVLQQEVPAESTHELVIEYTLAPTTYTMETGTVRMGFWMRDLATSGREYWEQYAPSNLEFDHFAQHVVLEVIGNTKPQVVFTNGELTDLGDSKFEVQFPNHFTSSSFYLHITDPSLYTVVTDNISDGENVIPATFYANSSSDANSGLQRAKLVVAENGRTFGASVHDRFVAYITPIGGGMEYCGGTMTSLWALGHEFTHFWFARGVMPADGNAGWIDEATASWRDNGYNRLRPTKHSPVNMSGYSPYKRHTHMAAYSEGARLLAEFDSIVQSFDGERGFRGVLAKLYQEKALQSITVTMFQSFIETLTGADLDAMFKRYVYGQSYIDDEMTSPVDILRQDFPRAPSHPRPYTREELRRFR